VNKYENLSINFHIYLQFFILADTDALAKMNSWRPIASGCCSSLVQWKMEKEGREAILAAVQEVRKNFEAVIGNRK
jgi:hypothetical protein